MRASFNPIAIACLRLFTFRPEPLLSVPFFFRCIADLTRLPAARPYLAMSPLNASAVLTEGALVRDMLSDTAMNLIGLAPFEHDADSFLDSGIRLNVGRA